MIATACTRVFAPSRFVAFRMWVRDRLGGEVQAPGDLPARQALGQEPEDLVLARAQRCRPRWLCNRAGRHPDVDVHGFHGLHAS